MRGIFVVFKKEFLDTIRDRRTLVAMVLVPLVLFPLLFVGGTWLAQSQMEEAEKKSLTVAVLGEEGQDTAAPLRQSLASASNIDIAPDVPVDTARARIQDGAWDAAFVFADSFHQQVQAKRAGTVELIYETDDDSEVMLSRLRPLLDRYEDQLLRARFEALGLSTEATRAVQVQQVNLASEKAQMAQQVGGFLPYMFLIFCFMGAMYPALDMGAGEKERGTLETLLTAPVSRFQFLVGKTLTITLAGLFAAVVSVLSIMGSVWFIEDIPEAMLETAMSILSPSVVGVLLSLLVPLTVFFAAAQLSLSFYAKSFKEAQSIVSPLTIAVLFPAFIGLLPGFSLNTTTALIPVLNVALATKDALAGTLGMGHLALVYASLLALAAVSLVVCMFVIRSERVLFRT
ncbi:MAG TPA: ABC transporter permease [Salinibacter sp.]|nr:ABC transporter permease [Salinibacter sp.]